MLQALKNLFRTSFVIYSCICLIGCVTSKALEYTAEIGETETRLWNVQAITFAAIRDNRFVRMCIEFSSPTDTTETELSIDLQEITQQLNNQEATISVLEDEVNTESSLCSLELEEDEMILPISVVNSDAHDIVEALQSLKQEPLDEPVVSLLQHETGSYLVFGAPISMYEGLDTHALGTYIEIEQHYSPSIFLLMPIAIAADVVIISAMVILFIPCVIPILFPLCIPFAIVAGIIDEADSGSYEYGYLESESEDLFE